MKKPRNNLIFNPLFWLSILLVVPVYSRGHPEERIIEGIVQKVTDGDTTTF